MKRYVKAVEAFGMAAHLDPAQGDYSAHLGYALHLTRPKNELVRREALEHIAKGIKLAPDSWKPLVFLGRVFRAAGEPDNARKVLRRALKIQPDCHAALQELRLLGQPEMPEKPRGLLERLLDHWIFKGRRSS
jgi:tetratricopeptide (TPR) repeat protein